MIGWDKKRLPWLLGALGLMFMSAWCGLLWIDVVGRMSGWIGLPEYEGQIPRLHSFGTLWSILATTLPFLAALLLGIGERTASHA